MADEETLSRSEQPASTCEDSLHTRLAVDLTGTKMSFLLSELSIYALRPASEDSGIIALWDEYYVSLCAEIDRRFAAFNPVP